MLSSQSQYLREIDGFRALAVLAVIIFHLNDDLLPGGFSGVDVFFVISGYVVTKSLSERSFSGFWGYLGGFYRRRLLRILPPLLVCLLVTSLCTVLFLPEAWLSSSVKQTALAAFGGISNYALVWFNDGYFSHRAEFNPFTHTWSLAVEEQFYLVFPLLLYGWLSFRKPFRNIVCFLLPALALLSLGWAAFGEHVRGSDYFLLTSRFWELAAGALLYQAHAHGVVPPPQEGAAHRVLTVGTVVTAIGLVASDPFMFPWPWALLPVLGTAMMIHGIAGAGDAQTALRSLFSHRVTVYLGRISYSLYLWHWPVFVLFRWTVGLQTWSLQLLALVITFAAAMASWHWLEQGLTSRNFVKKRSNQGVVFGMAFIVLICLVGAYGLFQQRPNLTLSVTANQYDWQPLATSVPAGLTEPDHEGPLQGRSLFVVGNSHTGAYKTMLDMAEQRLGIKVHTYQVMTCPVVHLLEPTPTDNPGCNNFMENLIHAIYAKGKPGDIVFFASLRTHRLVDQWGPFDLEEVVQWSHSKKQIEAIELARERAHPMLAKLEELGFKVLIDAPKPVFRAVPFRCSDWFNQINPFCREGFQVDRKLLEYVRKPVIDSMKKIAKTYSNIYLWDPFPVLCPEERCSAFHDGRPLFFDGDHLSGLGNRFLYPAFERHLGEIWNSDSELAELPSLGAKQGS